MDEADTDSLLSFEVVDPETRQMLGMFDVPAFAKRGKDLEHALLRLHARCRVSRLERLEMVHLRLRQWASAVQGPEAWPIAFEESLQPLWEQAAAPPPNWARQTASVRRCRLIARDLHTSVSRFNRLWLKHLDELNLQALNTLVEHYNRYYVIEKECFVKSARLAALHFSPRPPVTSERF